MSEVKKISPVGNIYGWEESQFGEFVLSQDYDDLAEEAQALREEVAALRARVVVVPDAANDRRKSAHYCRGWNACLDELARRNGKTVSASALDTLRRFATGEVGHLNNGHCPDGLEGHETRDPDCPVCRALIDTEKSK